MRKPDINRSAASAVILTAIFLAFIAFFTFGTLFTDDREFSEMENRTLAQKPEVSAKTLFSGELDDNFEDYLSDQIFLKDGMMSIKTCCDYFSGKTYQNGVYFSEDGYLLQRYDEDTENIKKNVSYINAFAEKIGKRVDFLLVPNSISVNAEKLPMGAQTDDQLESIKLISDSLSDDITLFNAYDTVKGLQEQGIQAYYRTDHHWTASAARATADAWLESVGMSGTDANYLYREVPDFYGTLYSKAPAGFIKPDTFGYYENASGKYTLEYIAEKKFTYSMMDKSYLDKKDKYSAFFGGNFSQIKIESDCPDGGKLLILKDSYANSMIPLLADKFSEIYVVDMRYFHFDKVSELIEQNGIERVLMIYNLDFVNEDKNFIWLE